MGPNRLQSGTVSKEISIRIFYPLRRRPVGSSSRNGCRSTNFYLKSEIRGKKSTCTVLPAKSDSDDMFCLQTYQGLVID